MSLDEHREEIRRLCETVLIDGTISFVALIRERGYRGALASLAIEEWSKALHDFGQRASELLDEIRALLLAGADLDATLLDASFEEAITQRQSELREQWRQVADAREGEDKS